MRWRISLTCIMLFAFNFLAEMIEYNAVCYLAMKLNKRRYKMWVIDEGSFLIKAYDHGFKNHNDQRIGNRSSF